MKSQESASQGAFGRVPFVSKRFWFVLQFLIYMVTIPITHQPPNMEKLLVALKANAEC